MENHFPIKRDNRAAFLITIIPQLGFVVFTSFQPLFENDLSIIQLAAHYLLEYCVEAVFPVSITVPIKGTVSEKTLYFEP